MFGGGGGEGDRLKKYLPASNWREPSTLVCLGVLRMCGRKVEAAASRVRAPITAIATPIPMVTVLACHQPLGMSQKLKSNVACSIVAHRRILVKPYC